MKASCVHQILRELAEQQWGLFTTAQARFQGVSGVELQRARRAGAIVSIRHGVHRLVGTPEDRFEALRAEWLATCPGRMAYERFGGIDSVVVSGETAAWVHEVGDLVPEPYQFTSVTRHQSRSTLVSFRRREIPDDQVTVVAGLPVTTLEATVKDLMAQGEDLSLVADVLDEAATRSEFHLETFQHLVEDMDPSQVSQVQRLAGLDLDSQALRLARTPAGQALVAEIAQQLAPLQGIVEQALKPTRAAMEQWTRSHWNDIFPKITIPAPTMPAIPLSPQTRQAITSVLQQAISPPSAALRTLQSFSQQGVSSCNTDLTTTARKNNHEVAGHLAVSDSSAEEDV